MSFVSGPCASGLFVGSATAPCTTTGLCEYLFSYPHSLYKAVDRRPGSAGRFERQVVVSSSRGRTPAHARRCALLDTFGLLRYGNTSTLSNDIWFAFAVRLHRGLCSTNRELWL